MNLNEELANAFSIFVYIWKSYAESHFEVTG